MLYVRTPSGIRNILLASFRDTMETQSISWVVRELTNDKRLHFHLPILFLTYYERLNSFRSQEHPLNFLEGHNKDFKGIRVNQRFINSEQSQTLQELLCLILIFIVSIKEAKRMFLTIDRVLTFISCQKCYIWVKMKHHVKI